jgi:hypothetical protein
MSEERAEYGAGETRPLTIETLEAETASPAEVNYRLQTGHTVRFRVFQDAGEAVRVRRQAEAAAKIAAHPENAPAPWKPFLPQESVIIENCFMLAAFLVEPAIPFEKALEWAKTRALLYGELMRGMNAILAPAEATVQQEAIETAKNG